MGTWSRALAAVSPAHHDPSPSTPHQPPRSCRRHRWGAPSGWGWDPPRRGPSGPPRPVSALAARGLLPSKASCQQKSSCADSGEREGDPGTEGRGYEGKGTDRRRRAGPSKDLASLQHHPHSLALVSNLSPLRWRLQEPDQSLPPCSPPPSCTCFPHLTFEKTLQNADTRTKRLTASFDAL